MKTNKIVKTIPLKEQKNAFPTFQEVLDTKTAKFIAFRRFGKIDY